VNIERAWESIRENIQISAKESVGYYELKKHKPWFEGKKKLHDLSPQANYTDLATAACRQSDCQLFADRGCHVISVTDPYGRILGFLDRSRYFSIK
jgi:hypothetical protein